MHDAAAGLGFAAAQLQAFLSGALADADGPMAIERISGGQSNPTFFVTFGDLRLVLRKQPPGSLLPTAHQIDREYRVVKALGQTDVPVPEMLLYCEDPTIIGTPFYVMRRVDGTVFHDCRLYGMAREYRRDAYRSLAQSLARLHAVDPDAAGLGDYGRKGNYFARQVVRWSRQWDLSRQGDDPNIDTLVEWLPRNIPDDDNSTIVHGDYRPGNVIFAADAPNVAAILDWELSTLGHPLADLAHCCMAWRTGPDEYGGLLGLDLDALGLPGQTEFENWYYEAAGHSLHLQPFHVAFALFRFAVIFEGIAARAKDGTAASSNAGEVGHLARVFARRAVEAI